MRNPLDQLSLSLFIIVKYGFIIENRIYKAAVPPRPKREGKRGRGGERACLLPTRWCLSAVAARRE